MIDLAVKRAVDAWSICDVDFLRQILSMKDLSREEIHVLMGMGIPANRCVPEGRSVTEMIIALTGE